MSTRKIFSIIGVVLTLFLIGNLFIPFLSNGGTSLNFWEVNEKRYEGNFLNIALLIVLIVGALIYVLQICGALKTSKTAFFTIGFYLAIITGYFSLFSNTDTFSASSASFWLGLIIGIVLLIINIISGFVSNDSKAKTPVSYDSQTGQPIYQ